jgi:hypothetical protein
MMELAEKHQTKAMALVVGRRQFLDTPSDNRALARAATHFIIAASLRAHAGEGGHGK